MIHLVTFSDHHMNRSRQLCIESALKHGVDSIAGPHYFDPALEYRDGFTLEWLKSQSIYKQMGETWWAQRGIGYWLWKPYIIDLVMSKLQDGEYLVYSDAGVEFIDNIRYIVDRMEPLRSYDVMLLPEHKAATGGQGDIFLFGNNWEHAHWCKAEVVGIWPGFIYNVDWSRFSKQVQASVILSRVSDYSRKLVKEWLDWCLFEGGRLIDDSPSRTPNHPEFREHRHDQAILTTLAYREGIKLHYWPAMYNDGAFTYEKLPEYAGDDYPVLFHHHRRRDSEWSS